MNKELIKKLNKFYLDFSVGVYIDERIIKNKYSILTSKILKDCDCNFALDLQVNSNEEFEEVWQNIKQDMQSLNRKPTFTILPIQEFLYSNLEKLNNRFELVSREVWQVYDNFEDVDKIKTNCNLRIILEKVTDYNKFAMELLESFKGDENDPYGELDSGYLEVLKNYKNRDTGFEKEFYFVKNGEQIIGVTADVYDDTFYGIHGLAIKKEFRAKGIGKEVLKKQLQMCREKNKIAFIQTEEGYYPAELYRKIGFKDVCIEYYYQEKNEKKNLKG